MVHRKIMECRRNIDHIDFRIGFLLNERIKNVKRIMQVKKKLGLKKVDASREKEIMTNLAKAFPKNKKIIKHMYSEMFLFTRKVK